MYNLIKLKLNEKPNANKWEIKYKILKKTDE